MEGIQDRAQSLPRNASIPCNRNDHIAGGTSLNRPFRAPGFHLIGQRTPARASDRWSFPLYVFGGLVFVFAFLAAGHLSTPRRFAVHLPPWLAYDQAGTVGAALVIAAMLVFTFQIIVGLSRPPGNAHAALAAG